MFRDVRIVGERLECLGEHVWNRLLGHRNSSMYQNKYATITKYRSFKMGGSLYTGGSIPTHEHVISMINTLIVYVIIILGFKIFIYTSCL